MTSQELLTRVHALGVKVALGPGGKLRVSPPGKLPEELREALRRHKAEVLALLMQQPPWPCPQCGGQVHLEPPVPEETPAWIWTCACGAWGATRPGATIPVVWVGNRTMQ